MGLSGTLIIKFTKTLAFAVLEGKNVFKATVKSKRLFKARSDTLQWKNGGMLVKAYDHTWLCFVLKVTKTNQVQKSIQ